MPTYTGQASTVALAEVEREDLRKVGRIGYHAD